MGDVTSFARGRLRTDVLLMFANRAGGLILTAASSVIVARALGAEGRGTVAVALGFTLVLVQVGNLGLTTANPYFASKNPAAIPRVVMNAAWLAGSLGIVLALVGLAIHEWLPAALPGLATAQVAVALGAVPAMLGMSFLQSVLLAEGRTMAYNATEFALTFALVVALIVGFTAFDMNELGVLVAVTARYLTGALIYWALLARHTVGVTLPDFSLIQRMVGYALRVYIVNLLAFLVIRADLLLVNAYLGKTEAGLYSISVALADLLLVLPAVVGANLFPRIAAGAAQGTTALAFRTIGLLHGVVCAVTVLAADPVIRVLYGSEFQESAALFVWLAPGLWALGMTNILLADFSGRGFPRQAVLLWVPGLGLNLAINLLFLNEHGTYVAALSSSIAYGALLLLHVRLFAREGGGYRALVPRPRETVAILAGSLRRAAPQT